MEVGDEGKWLDLEEIKPMFVPTGQDHMMFVHMTQLIHVDSTSTCNAISKCSCIHPSSEGCGRQPARELGVEECEGEPRKWEAQAVHCKNKQQHLSLPIFSYSFFLCLLLTPVRPRL